MGNEKKPNVNNKGQHGFKGFFASSAGRIVLTVVFAIVIYGILFAVTASNNEYLALAIIAICGYFGYKALGRIQPSMFLWMSIFGWIVYFFIKAVLSALIGVFIAPFVIGKKLSELITSSLSEG